MIGLWLNKNTPPFSSRIPKTNRSLSTFWWCSIPLPCAKHWNCDSIPLSMATNWLIDCCLCSYNRNLYGWCNIVDHHHRMNWLYLFRSSLSPRKGNQCNWKINKRKMVTEVIENVALINVFSTESEMEIKMVFPKRNLWCMSWEPRSFESTAFETNWPTFYFMHETVAYQQMMNTIY